MAELQTVNVPPGLRQLTEEESAAYYAALLSAPRKRRRPVDWRAFHRLIHHTELGTAGPESPLAEEWSTYLREVGRLLREGQQDRCVLIHGGQVVGLWDDLDAAIADGHRRFPGQPFLAHQVREYEPVYRHGFRR